MAVEVNVSVVSLETLLSSLNTNRSSGQNLLDDGEFGEMICDLRGQLDAEADRCTRRHRQHDDDDDDDEDANVRRLRDVATIAQLEAQVDDLTALNADRSTRRTVDGSRSTPTPTSTSDSVAEDVRMVDCLTTRVRLEVDARERLADDLAAADTIAGLLHTKIDELTEQNRMLRESLTALSDDCSAVDALKEFYHDGNGNAEHLTGAVAALRSKVNLLEVDNSALNRRVEVFAVEKHALAERCTNFEGESTAIKSRNCDLLANVDLLTSANGAMLTKLEKFDSQCKTLLGTNEVLNKCLKELENENTNFSNEIVGYRIEVTDNAKVIKNLQDAQCKHKHLIESLQEKSEINSDHFKSLAMLESENESLVKKVEDQSHSKNIAASVILELKNNGIKLTEDLGEARSNIIKYQNRINESELEIKYLKEEKIDIDNVLAGVHIKYKTDMESNLQVIESKSNELNVFAQRLNICVTELELLKNVEILHRSNDTENEIEKQTQLDQIKEELDSSNQLLYLANNKVNDTNIQIKDIRINYESQIDILQTSCNTKYNNESLLNLNINKLTDSLKDAEDNFEIERQCKQELIQNHKIEIQNLSRTFSDAEILYKTNEDELKKLNILYQNELKLKETSHEVLTKLENELLEVNETLKKINEKEHDKIILLESKDDSISMQCEPNSEVNDSNFVDYKLIIEKITNEFESNMESSLNKNNELTKEISLFESKLKESIFNFSNISSKFDQSEVDKNIIIKDSEISINVLNESIKLKCKELLVQELEFKVIQIFNSNI